MFNQYKTVSNFSKVRIEEKKSKFIASIKPVESEQEAIKFINEIKSNYYDATHNVYCYDISNEFVIQRYSDDKEPAGTAGLPILELIKKLCLKNLVIVVTRYFGGTLLGTAGLVRAYTKAAMTGIDKAGIIKKVLCDKLIVLISYNMIGKFESFIFSKGYKINDCVYTENVCVAVFVPVEEVPDFLADLNEITGTNSEVNVGERVYVTLN